MAMMSIGEFARRSRLSPKALRLYDELGLLAPARVDAESGYRFYEAGQLERARLVAMLRQIGLPLAQITTVVDLEAAAAGEAVAAYWARTEADHAARRDLAGYLVDHLNGKRSIMYEVTTRQIPQRRLLCLKRHVDEQGAWALGKEFVGLFTERPVPRPGDRAGAAFVIYHGQVNQDSDGPIEWCRPVPDDQADALAARFPELTLRSEPAHEEAFVSLGTGETPAAEWPVIAGSLFTWADEQNRRPSELGVRVTFLASSPLTSGREPDRDFAVPLADV